MTVLKCFIVCSFQYSNRQCGDVLHLVARLLDVSSPLYPPHIDHIAAWFADSFLDLNVTKTKELCLGGGTGAEGPGSIFMPVTMSGGGRGAGN